ncbi:hypothetical protein Clacol_001667 [Clathrus columnatus]|uniref:Uncharacterized protein n=1 Tax=Clathrus columnatus TaxID=1419009 RepID=A0AAV5A6C6_9AGAM|nr:hypothetical protein Clacol_001667 [Clathrus columnatus]
MTMTDSPVSTTSTAGIHNPASMISHERFIQRIRELVSATNPDPDSLLSEGGVLFAQLKGLNRITNATTRDHKQKTTEARQTMDHTHLGLQNLMYERRHFEKEIDKCRQFASIYQDISLYSLEEFLKLAPPELQTEDILQTEHQLMLTRLNFELTERQRLDEFKKQLVTERDNLLKESRERQSKLDIINFQIEQVSKASLEAQSKIMELVPSKLNVTGTDVNVVDAPGKTEPAIIITPALADHSGQTS